jgi:Ca-activated chloride channel family protein
MAAEHPLTLTVDVAGSLARGTIECPTHDFRRLDTPEGARLTLASGAWLDRDVVVLVKPEIARGSFAVRARDEKSAQAPWVVMAMLQPPPSVPRPAVALKLLVDCSGSMGGDSISSARVALGGLLPGLGGPDYLSLTRFGSTVEHAMRPTACSAPALRRAAFVAQKLDADLGGTEMEAALSAAFELPVPGEIGMADVLLLTDGEVWEVEPMIAAARASRHRVFVIGVGASPAEAPLRALAKATGGACEFATPGEDLEAAAKRMLGRIRQQPLSGLSVDWGSPPVWQSELPQGTFGDDALVVFAGLSSTSQQMPVRLLANGAKGPQELASCSAETMAVSDSLPRLAAARRMAAVDTEHALALAVDYQLMSGQTNCILVHEREGADKASGVAELHRVQSMLAAGWAATGSVVAEAQEGYQDAFAMPSSGGASTTVRMFRSHAPSAFDLVDRFSMGDLDDDTDDVRVAMQAVEPPASLKEIARAVADQLAQGGPVGGLQSYCSALQLPPEVKAALVEAAAICADGGLGWLLMAIWITTRGIGDKDALKVLQPKLAGINQELVDVCMAMFVERLGPIVSAVTSNSRGQRLAQAMDRRGQ